MLIRSSSTPLLGSLVPSLISDSPNHHHQTDQLHGPPTHKHTPAATCVISSINGNIGAKSCVNGFRRVQSDGNLEGLAGADYLNTFSNKLGRRRRNSISCCTMRSVPSHEYHDEEKEDEEEEEEEEEEELHDVFKAGMMRVEQCEGDEGKMYLATGLGGSNGGGGGRCYRPVAFDRGGGMEEHYQKMLEQDPGNSLVLTNYAHFLYNIKGDGGAAEEYYSRAILADEGEDGEILSQYAKLIWELHGDKDRAANYFQRAVEVSSDNSHIHAAYACFLWDIEDEDNAAESSQVGQPLFHHGFIASATA